MIKTIEYLIQEHGCITGYTVDMMLSTQDYKLKVFISQQDRQLISIECMISGDEYKKFLTMFEENKEQSKGYAQELSAMR